MGTAKAMLDGIVVLLGTSSRIGMTARRDIFVDNCSHQSQQQRTKIDQRMV